MNWSTRLRRWVRIRMPPVREASMKPTAATVLPAPVACSNQKRRSAPGSSGASVTDLLGVLLGGRLLPVLGLLLGGQLLGLLGLLGLRRLGLLSPPRRPRRSVLVLIAVLARPRRPPRPRTFRAPPVAASASSASSASAWTTSSASSSASSSSSAVSSSASSSAAVCCSAISSVSVPGEGIDLVRVEFGAVEQLRRFVGEQALEPEQQREVAAPLDRRVLGAGVDLGQGGVERPAAGGSLGERLGALAVEQERLAGELRRTLDIGACWNCRSRGNFAGLGH